MNNGVTAVNAAALNQRHDTARTLVELGAERDVPLTNGVVPVHVPPVMPTPLL